MSEKPVTSPLLMDRSDPVGNSLDAEGRRALHVKQTAGTLVTEAFDQVLADYPDDVTEVYSFLLGSVLQTTVTVVYIDETKALIQSVVKT